MSQPDKTRNAASVWGREDWGEASVTEMRDYLDRIAPPWGMHKTLLAMKVVEAFWIAYEALERLEADANG